jgi:peptidyl-prolyl cis-trans isomerase A (cyclophilin A)
MRTVLSLFTVLAAVAAHPGASLAQTSKQPQSKASPRAAKPAGQPEGKTQDTTMANPSTGIPQGKGDLYAIFQTSVGNITCRLFEKDAPETVANFVGLAMGAKEWTDPRTGAKTHAKLYDGTKFHRVIPNFMIQGGDPLGTGTGDPGFRFKDEFQSGRKFDKPGLLAMANAGPNTNGSQFFIVTTEAAPWLDGKHTVFGRVTEGMDAVEAIESARTGANDRPLEPQVIERIELSD